MPQGVMGKRAPRGAPSQQPRAKVDVGVACQLAILQKQRGLEADVFGGVPNVKRRPDGCSSCEHLVRLEPEGGEPFQYSLYGCPGGFMIGDEIIERVTNMFHNHTCAWDTVERFGGVPHAPNGFEGF